MPISDILLALLVVCIWGINFLFVKLSLQEMPPLFLCTLRFLLASLPVIFFIKPPAMPFSLTIGYGLVMFALQFSFLFLGMYLGMTPGMASLIMQVQVFFSMFFAIFLLKEMPHIWQVSGAVISFLGILMVGGHLDHTISFSGFCCILLAAAMWGIGNLITKKHHHINMMALVIWGSFIACFPLMILTFFFEGWQSVVYSYKHVSEVGIVSLLYIVYISTWLGYGIWNRLLSRYPVGVIVPFTLLVPIIGILSSIWVFQEPFQLWKLEAGVLVIAGLAVNLFGARFLSKKQP